MAPEPDYKRVDAREIQTEPLSARKSFIDIAAVAADPSKAKLATKPVGQRLDRLAKKMSEARQRGAAVVLAYGAHLVKNGAGTLVNALIDAGAVTHAATQGAGVIHDWEFAFQGASSESVRENAPVGQFGSWDETGRCINLAVVAGAAEGLGFGEAIGRFIASDGVTLPAPEELARQIADEPSHPLTGARADLLDIMNRFHPPIGRMTIEHPFKRYSVPACAYGHGVPFTVHPGIGYDIIVNHPMFHGGAVGRAGEWDARALAHSLLNLTGGVYLSIGSAVMSPQVFEKAFSCANNLLAGRGEPFVRDHMIAIVDIQDGGNWDWATGEPPPDHPAYYLRFCKSFYRMGGEVSYIQLDNRAVLSHLVARLC
jgi:hypothetical protein